MSLVIGLISGNELFFASDSRVVYGDGLIDTTAQKFWRGQASGHRYFVGSTGNARVAQVLQQELKLDGLLAGRPEDYHELAGRVREVVKGHDLIDKAPDTGRSYISGYGRMLFGFRTPEGKLTLATLTGDFLVSELRNPVAALGCSGDAAELAIMMLLRQHHHDLAPRVMLEEILERVAEMDPGVGPPYMVAPLETQ